jgi:hypothetical protein
MGIEILDQMALHGQALDAVIARLGRIVALYHHSSASYQIR